MARAGTLPSFLYQREIMPGGSVDLTGEIHRSEDEDGYETCSSEEEGIDEEDDSQSISTLDREANFLLGRVSTFGRADVLLKYSINISLVFSTIWLYMFIKLDGWK